MVQSMLSSSKCQSPQRWHGVAWRGKLVVQFHARTSHRQRGQPTG